MRLLFVAEGDAETTNCWSGCAKGFVSALRRSGADVTCVNVELVGWRRRWVAIRSLRPDLREWRWRFRLGTTAFRHKSRVGVEQLRSMNADWDAVIQAGAPASLPRDVLGPVPYVIYCDANILFARRAAPWSAASTLPESMIEELAQCERAVYDTADRIWTWSLALAESFVEDFGQDPGKVAVLHAGANLETIVEPANGPSGSSPEPSVLFVGRDYNRKGLDVLVEAFALVRRKIPAARLHVVGADPEWAKQPGVVVHGFIPAGTPEGRSTLSRLYRDATVFCLPSRYEPFGVSFAEAMLAGLPCVGVHSWAMPEIIEDGVTGWLVPDGDVRRLAEVLETALHDPEASAEMGRRGRERASRMFTWDRVAERATADLERLVGDKPDSEPAGPP